MRLISFPEHVVEINKKLKEIYREYIPGTPWYKVVWSSNEREKRFGTFNDFIPGTNLFLRKVTEIREVPKYWWCKDRWIIEKYMELPPQAMLELMDNKGYQPIWVIQNVDDFTYLDARWDVVEQIVYFCQHGHTRSVNPETQQQALDNQNEQYQKEVIENREMLD